MTFSPFWVFFEAVAEKENPEGGDKKVDYFCFTKKKNNYATFYHSNATTNLNIRSQIQNNLDSNSVLATRFNVSEQTISKWRNRDFTKDASCKPLNIVYALSDLEKALVISLRKAT